MSAEPLLPPLPPHTMSASMLAVPENLRKYVREYAEAYARSAQAAAQGWLPIESAPKDGTTVLLCRHMGDFGFVRGYGRFEGKDGAFLSGWITVGFDPVMSNLGLAHPTHWQPLPPPPQNLIAKE